MAVLFDLINSLNKEESRNLKLFLGRTNFTAERKDILLFDFVKNKHPEHKEEEIIEKMYGKKGKNPYYRLKNRLLQDIGKSVALLHIDSSDFNHSIHYLSLSHLYEEKGRHKLSLYFLQKAEKKAEKAQGAELLDIIYTAYIRLSHEILTINPEQFILKRKNNREALSRLREIDDVLAVLVYRIKRSQNLASQDTKVIDILQKSIDNFAKNPEVRKSVQLRMKIYHALSRILLQQHDYESLEQYLRQTYEKFTKEQLFTKTNHDTKLQMLTYLANSLFKNNKLKESLQYTKELKIAMDEHKGVLRDKYLFYYYNILVYNYSRLNPKKAIEILNEALKNKQVTAPAMNQVFIHLNFFLLYFDQKDIKQANRHLVKLKLNEASVNLDEAFKLKIAIAELIIRYEMGDSYFIEGELKRIQKTHKHLLTTAQYKRQASMLEIMRHLTNTKNIAADKKLQQKMCNVKNELTLEDSADKDILSYRKWLAEKVN